jgi:hypothetical protein
MSSKLRSFPDQFVKRPDWNRLFYLKTDWSSKGISAVLLQAETAPDAEDATMPSKIKGDVCQFNKTLSEL